MRIAAAALAGAVAANTLALKAFQSPLPSPAEMQLTHGNAVEAVSLLALGMRRLAADLEFIRLLMYYGGEESPQQDQGAWRGIECILHCCKQPMF